MVRDSKVSRLGEPEDIAHLVTFTVAPEGRFLHGSVIEHGWRPDENNLKPRLFVWFCVVWFAVFGIEIPAKDKNAGQREQEKNKAKSQPDGPPEICQIEHRRKHGGNEKEQSGERGGYHL